MSELSMTQFHVGKSRFRSLDPLERDALMELITLGHSRVKAFGAPMLRNFQLVSENDPTQLTHSNQWNTPGRIKPGRTFKHCPFCELDVHILAVDPVGICIAAEATSNDGFHVLRTDNLGRLSQSHSRLSVQETARHLFRFIYSLKSSPYVALRWLLAMFHGEMGEQYSSLVGEAWAVRAGYAINNPDTSPELVEWARHVLELSAELGVPREHLPPELEALAAIVDPYAQPVSFGPGWSMDDAFDEFMRSVEQLDQHVHDLVHGPDLGPPPEEEFDFQPGILAICSRYETEVVVLGPSLIEQDKAYFDVLDIDEYKVYVVHGSELESEGYNLDEEELLEIIDQSDVWNMEVYMFLARYPWTTFSVSKALGCLIYVAIFRAMSAAGFPSSAVKSHYRQAREQYLQLSKEDRKLVMAAAPEINAPKGGVPAAKGSAESVFLVSQKIIQDILAHARGKTVPAATLAAPVADQPPGPSSEPIPLPPPRDEEVVEQAEQGSPEDAVVEPVPADQTGRDKKARLLRFKVSDHRLLAMEWDLVESEGAYGMAVASTLDWLRERLGVSLPQTWESGGHELELGGVRIQLEAGDRIFALRMEHPDQVEVARTWRVEAMVIAGTKGRGGMVGIRVGTQDRTKLPEPGTGIPGLVVAWQQSPGLMLGAHATAMSQQVRTAKEFEAWRASLAAPRQHMISVTTDPSGFAPNPGFSTIVQRVTMLREAVRSYEDVYGRPWEGCVHAFAPGEQGPRNWNVADRAGLGALQASATALRQRPGMPTFKQLRDMVRENTIPTIVKESADQPEPIVQSLAPADEVAPQVATEHTQAPQESSGYRSDELQMMLDIALSDHATTQNELDERRAEVTQLRSKLQALQAQLSIRSEEKPTLEAIPTTLDKLPAWIPSLQPRLVIVDKALRVASRTEHRDVPRIYRALQALATDYWSSRFEGDERAYANWTEFLKENRMRWGSVGVANDISRYQSEYQAVWEGRTYTMTHHLQGSSSRDPTRCIRIYVSIDEDRQLIVVGALPAHLTNTLT